MKQLYKYLWDKAMLASLITATAVLIIAIMLLLVWLLPLSSHL